MRSRGFTYIELAVVIAIIVAVLIVSVPLFQRAMEGRRVAACQMNLKVLGLALKMYSGENDGWYPPVHGYEIFGMAANAPGCENVEDKFDLIPDLRMLMPDYLPVAEIQPGRKYSLTCLVQRADAGIVRDDGSGTCGYVGAITNGDATYTYFGHHVIPDTITIDAATAETLGLARTGTLGTLLVEAYLIKAIRTEDRNLLLTQRSPYESFDNKKALHTLVLKDVLTEESGIVWFPLWYDRFREGVDRSFVIDLTLWRKLESKGFMSLQKWGPIMWETPSSSPDTPHQDSVMNVLFFDGHVEPYQPGTPAQSNKERAIQNALDITRTLREAIAAHTVGVPEQ